MKYQILIRYRTGNSFNSEDTEEVIDLEFEDLQVAKDNLKRIQEHYKLYEEERDWRRKGSWQLHLQKYKHKDWFILNENLAFIKDIEKDDYYCVDHKSKANGTVIDPFYATYCIKLKTDEGKDFQLSCFWCGYFETLYGAKIVSKQPIDDDLEFEL